VKVSSPAPPIKRSSVALDSIQPTLIITGSGGADTAANTITFNFSKIIRDGSFTVDDIDIENGDKITQIGGGVISYQQVSKVNNICVGICLYVSYSKVINNIIACVFKTIIKDISTMMSIANMDNTLRGWANLDTAAGETAIQSNVIWDIGIVNYTDATAKQYLNLKYSNYQYLG
jgi:hypothetical protein